jgi:hypothetical protein
MRMLTAAPAAVPGLAPGKLNVEYVEDQARWHVPDFFAGARAGRRW